MPKVRLEFNVPEESFELHDALYGPDYKAVLQEIDNRLRGHIKYERDKHWDKATVESIRDLLYEELKDEGISLYD